MSTTDPRRILRIGGEDARGFLQGLITNDIARAEDGLVYAALLSPQGKYLADFFITRAEGAYLVDVAEPLAASLAQRLTMYKLRSDVTVEATELAVTRGVGTAPDGALTDPRHADLGWRLYCAKPDDTGVDWEALRVRHGVPASLVELIPNDSYPLEMRFEALNGVDFRKGCYVGQEVTARMKHKTELRKGLAVVDVSGSADMGTEIVANGKAAGTLFTQADGKALAYLRFDRAGEAMQAGAATVSWRPAPR